MKGYYSIGELSKLSGLSHDTLRYYDKIGLLKADYVDEESRYRYYKLNAFWKTDVIKMFRMLNMPLDELKDVLPNRGNLDVLSASLLERKKETRQQLQRLKTMVKDIEWFEEMLSEMRDIRESQISLIHKKRKKVIYASNTRQASEYHLMLLDICLEEMSRNDSMQRKYGYLLKPESLQEDAFLLDGEYMDLYKKKYLYTAPEYLIELPEGDYVTQILNIRENKLNMEGIRTYLKRQNLKPVMITAEEVGLPLDSFNNFYCKVEVLVE